MSRRPGIGANYVATHAKWHQDDLRMFTRVNGVIGRLPRFYVDRIFSEEQKLKVREMAPSERIKYYESIAELAENHDDPHSQFAANFKYEHDSIKHKDNQFNKF